jgi:SAM-dependent methyltransferase
MAQTDIPDAQQKIGSRDKDVPWYNDSIGSQLGPSARKLLEEYSHIPVDQVESHIYAIVRALLFPIQIPILP